MANSINFNAIDLSDYGLVVTHSNLPDFRQQYDSRLIQDTSYGFRPKKPPKIISLDVTVSGATRAILDGYLDSIKEACVYDIVKVLKLDIVTDRYWNAKNTGLDGGYRAAGTWQGNIAFKADDPMAYDNTEEDNDHAINADPKSVLETTGGTGTILPVYTLTAKEALGAITIKLENVSLDEEIQWTGTLTTDDELEINVPVWTVSKNGTEDMADVTGKFPRLGGNLANTIKVTALYSAVAGVLNITYRNRFL